MRLKSIFKSVIKGLVCKSFDVFLNTSGFGAEPHGFPFSLFGGLGGFPPRYFRQSIFGFFGGVVKM